MPSFDGISERSAKLVGDSWDTKKFPKQTSFPVTMLVGPCPEPVLVVIAGRKKWFFTSVSSNSSCCPRYRVPAGILLISCWLAARLGTKLTLETGLDLLQLLQVDILPATHSHQSHCKWKPRKELAR